MKYIPLQPLADLRQRSHLQDPHLRLRAVGHRTDGIQHRLHLRLDIQRHVLGLGLIRRRHRREHLQRTRHARRRRQLLTRHRHLAAAAAGRGGLR